MAADIQAGRFAQHRQPAVVQRSEAYARLRQGEFYIQSLHATSDGQPIRVPSGLIHHWAGLVFLPGTTLSQLNAVLRDYGDQQQLFKPEIQQSKVIEQEGDNSKVFLRLYYKSLATAVLDASFDNQAFQVGENRILIESHSTRIAEVKNASQPDEYELPVGRDSGYLWRSVTYWRLEAKDGGVYLELETVGLSRTIPPFLIALVAPLTRSIPRKVLSDFLNDMVRAVAANGSGKKTVNERVVPLSASPWAPIDTRKSAP